MSNDAAEVGVCPVCGCPGSEYELTQNDWRLSRCPECRFLFCHPMPTNDVLAALYGGRRSSAVDPKRQSKLRRARRHVRRVARWARGGDMLELGCGGGYVSGMAVGVAARVVGVDLDETRIQGARDDFPGAEFFCADAVGFADRGEQFDFVYASEVIEHIPDVVGFADALARLVRPGGHVYLTTPDLGHWRTPKDLTTWPFFHPPVHVAYFSRKTLARLLDRHGFDVVRKFWNPKPGLRIVARRRP